MIKHKIASVKLSRSQVALRLSSNINGNANDESDFPLKLL